MITYWGIVDGTLYLSGYATENATDAYEWDAYKTNHPWLNSTPYITSVVVENECEIPTYNAFYNLYKCTSMDLSKARNTESHIMGNMFCLCRALTSIDLSNFDTSHVTNMSSMFSGCEALTTLDVSNFDTSNVTNMRGMFGCKALTTLDVSNFDTSKVTTMEDMFSGCSKLTSLDLSNFDTSKVTTMEEMFNYCTALTTIYVSRKWSTNSITSSSDMFRNCTSLIGAVPYNSNKTDGTMANYSTGYLTYKQAPDEPEIPDFLYFNGIKVNTVVFNNSTVKNIFFNGSKIL